MIKKVFGNVLKIFIVFFIFEIIFFSYFKINGLNKKLELYKEKKISAESYKFFPEYGLVLPLPDKKIYHETVDYLDIFETKDVLGKGFGLFDDGIDRNKKVYSVALGDSFTRGLGSINNLENGWVELTEKKLGWIDIINLGNLGGGIPIQKYSYNKIKNLINHELVIYNFYTRIGFRENLNDLLPSVYIEKIKNSNSYNDKQIQILINELNTASIFKPHLNYLLKKEDNFIKSYTVAFALKFLTLLKNKNVIPAEIAPNFLTGKPKDFKKVYSADSRLLSVPDNMYELRNKFKDSIFSIDGRKFNYFEINKDQKFMNKVIDYSAKSINQFANEVKLSGKNFILIILPSKNDVYYSVYKDEILSKDQINYKEFISILKSKLDPQINVIDITDDVINFVERNPKIEIYYKNDNHYNLNGYRIVSKFISSKLKSLVKKN